MTSRGSYLYVEEPFSVPTVASIRVIVEVELLTWLVYSMSISETDGELHVSNVMSHRCKDLHF